MTNIARCRCHHSPLSPLRCRETSKVNLLRDLAPIGSLLGQEIGGKVKRGYFDRGYAFTPAFQMYEARHPSAQYENQNVQADRRTH